MNSSKKARTQRIGRAILTMEVMLLLWSEFAMCAVGNESPQRLPQHRIRTTRRMVPYGNKHPWQRQVGNIKSSHAEEITRKRTPDRDHRRTRMISGVIEDFFPESGSKMWSTISDEMSEEVPNSLNELNETTYQTHENIRMRASLTNHPSTGSAFLNEWERNQLLENIVHPMLNTWSQALSVIPVQGNLTIDKSQLYDGISCGPGIDSGLPSVVVPSEHSNVTIGVPGTDLLVYLNIRFHGQLFDKLNADIVLRRSAYEDQESLLPLVPKSVSPLATEIMLDDDPNPDNYTTLLLESDPPLLDVPECSGTYLASSTYCSTDQFDRPVAGMLHLCIGNDFFKSQNLQQNRVTVLHELGHILGFNSQSLAHFRDAKTGKPITPRDSHGDVKDKDVECTGIAEGRGSAKIPLPSSDIIRFEEVRGGQRVAMIVTPNVRQIVRNYFDCQILAGAELESYSSRIGIDLNQTDFVDQCISDHWERRLFKADIMNPIVDSVLSASNISPLTLAYFMDSGWYKVNSIHAAEPDKWGRASGCSFVDRKCISHEEGWHNSDDFFCSVPQSEGCTDDMTGKASCSMAEYSHALPIEYQYFANPTLGGLDSDLDFCPTFVGKQSDTCISNTKRQSGMEQFGDTSRCLSGKSGKRDSSLFCVPTACAIDEKTPYVRVDGIWQKCEYEGQYIASWFDDQDYVICPDPVRTCPSFYCPKDCLFDEFSGICDYTSGTCGCPLTRFTEFGFDTCNITMSDYLIHEASTDVQYVQKSCLLESDGKDIIDHTVRMFIHMSPGDVIGFVATSLVAIGTCFILGTYLYKCIRQSQGLCLPRFWNMDWHIKNMQLRQNNLNEVPHRNDKDKMVATLLHNMRVETTDPFHSQDPEMDCLPPVERTFLRSEMPHLGGLGRIVTVIGSRYVDDSIIRSGVGDDDAMTVDGTGFESGTSGLLELHSEHSTAGEYSLAINSNLTTSTPPISQTTRRRINRYCP